MPGALTSLREPAPAAADTGSATPGAIHAPASPAIVVPRSRAGRALLRAGTALTAFGLIATLFLGYEFLGTGLTHDRTQGWLLTTFRKSIITTTLDAPTTIPAEGSPVALLTIPAIGLDQVAVEGTSPADLKAGPGHLRDSPMPGEFGNSVIAGRRTTYGAPFGGLDRLKRGDPITATTGQGTFSYVVSDVRRQGARDASLILGTADNRLTLVTSDPAYLATGRLVVVAALQGKAVAVPKRSAVALQSSDLGLSGDALSASLAALWLVLLVVAASLTWRVRERWPASVRYMLATPVIIALAVLAFSSFDAVLPGTL